MPIHILSHDDNRQELYDYDTRTDGQPVYIGKAYASSLQTDAFWQIRKYTYDGSNNVTAKNYAGGSVEYNKIWSSRTTYDYSP